MGYMNSRFVRLTEVTHTLLRVGAGLFFMLHGGQKLLGWFGGFGGQPGATAPLMSLMGLAGVLELVGGVLILIGLLTRPVAFLLSGQMAVAYFMAHFPRGFWPIENSGEPAALFSLIFLYFAAAGAGRYSVDALISRRRRTDEVAATPEARPVEEERKLRRAG
jgi:putative oxidoreductase